MKARTIMLNVKELMENVCISDEGMDVAKAGYSNLDDAISEVADSAWGNRNAEIVDVYEAMDMFLPGHFGYLSAMNNNQSFDIHGAVRALQYEQTYAELQSEADEIRLYFAYNYLLNNLGIEEISEDNNTDIEILCESCFTDFDDIESELDSMFEEDDEEEEEEEESEEE